MSLHRITILWKKEVKDAFLSPLVYVLAGVFCVIIGWLFFNYIVYAKELHSATLTQTVLTPIFGNMNFIFLFLAPLLAMKTFAEEKVRGTLELLEMSHLTTWEMVWGKYFALLAIALFMLLFTLVFPLVLSLTGYNDWGMVLASYLGLFLSIASYLAVGLFSSSLSRNQLIAALLGFTLLMAFLLLALSVNATGNYYLGHFFKYLSVPYHFEKFVGGAIASYSVLFFCSFIFFFLNLTTRVLRARRW